ncbi:MAG: glycoside hydrolase family 92 protein [Victivallales bacterium]|nr:glycoside hydrolase family 92 protein [Victivallales bacterium]
MFSELENISEYISPFNTVDPFHGISEVDLPEPRGIARTWDWRKAQTGNCHPGACYPLGMVSVCPYSGMYPTGYGLNDQSSEYVPRKLLSRNAMDGVTHFHVSGTGGIGNYYNYFKVSPFPVGMDISYEPCLIEMEKEFAEPGYYSCLTKNGIFIELTVGAREAAHRYSGVDALLLDIMHGGLNISGNPNFKSVPDDSDYAVNRESVSGYIIMRGVRIFFHVLCPDSKIIDYPRGVVIYTRQSAVEFFIGFSFASQEQAVRNCQRGVTQGFDGIRRNTAALWKELLERIEVNGGTTKERNIFYSCLYHSLIKPCECAEESEASSFYDFATLWDQYKTQLPLIYTVFPEYGKKIAASMLTVIERKGVFPNGLLLENSVDRFYDQASGLAIYSLYDAFIRGLVEIPAAELLELMLGTLKNSRYYRDFAAGRFVFPLSHVLDFAGACRCIAEIASVAGSPAVGSEMLVLAENWKTVYDPATGLLRESSTYYEGTNWNYSFRLLHDMSGREALCGGRDNFVRLLETFFGYHDTEMSQVPFRRIIHDNRFEGLNNEPDMETPYAFAYAGRHDRTAEVVRAVMDFQFAPGRGGLPGNDDSGGLSSWYVWNALGLFPVTGQNTVMIGSPLFELIKLKLPDGTFSINNRNVSPENIYLQSASLDGNVLARPWFKVAGVKGNSILETKMAECGNSDSKIRKTERRFKMSAPSKAGICKLDNPARVKVSRQPGTELWA